MLDPETDLISRIPSQIVQIGVLNQIVTVKVTALSTDHIPWAGATCGHTAGRWHQLGGGHHQKALRH